MAKPEDELIAALELSTKGRTAKYKLAEKMANAPKAQRLSEVEPITNKILPWNYRRHYDWLKVNKPSEAQAYWNKWSYDPRPKPVDPFELEKKALAKLGRPTKSNKLRRRV